MVDIKKIKEEELEIIIVKGEVDASSSIQLDNAISESMETEGLKILVDLTGLEYISSAGLGVFMSYIEEVKKKNIQLALFGLNEKVAGVFEILGLDQLLTIAVDKEQAKAKVYGV
jgi:anti-sigma B factor antagonist